jgi:hypothetical protein
VRRNNEMAFPVDSLPKRDAARQGGGRGRGRRGEKEAEQVDPRPGRGEERGSLDTMSMLCFTLRTINTLFAFFIHTRMCIFALVIIL